MGLPVRHSERINVGVHRLGAAPAALERATNIVHENDLSANVRDQSYYQARTKSFASAIRT